MAKKQYYGIKYPFLRDDFQKFYVDANNNLKDKARSQLMHIVFTPKGERIRCPEFGTNLIKHIFEPNDTESWESIKTEITDSVTRWSNNIILNNVSVVQNENDESEIFVRLDYSVKEGNKITNDSIVVQI